MKQTPNYIKGVVLFSILVLPSVLYLYLTAGKHNFVYVPILADKSQDFIALVDENRLEQPKHHYINDFPLNDSLYFSDLDNKIKLIFYTKSSEVTTSKLIAYMLESEVWSDLGDYEDIYFLNFIVEDSTHKFKEKTFDECQIPKNQWINVNLNKEELLSYMEGNVWVGKITNKMLKNNTINYGQIIISDREGRIRTGFDNNDILLNTYNALSKYEIKHLRDDLKVLLAEYQRELKNKNE